MIAPLAKFIGWLYIQKNCRRISSINGQNLQMEEALEFLKGPDFIPGESQPARLEFNSNKSGLHFRFLTPRPSGFAENNIVYGRFYCCAGNWHERPTIILPHGGNMMRGGNEQMNYRIRQPLTASCCNRSGFNAATVELPYHFQRDVRRIEAFDHLRVSEAFAQWVAETRTLIGWLLDQGCSSIALFGFSLGGWLAGLTATRDNQLNAVVLALPGVRRDYSATRGERVLWASMRKALEKQKPAREALDKAPMNLTLSQPVISKENILLIQGRYDLLVEAEQTEELWQKWKQPEIWRLPHGHISWIFTSELSDRVLDWLAPRMN